MSFNTDPIVPQIPETWGTPEDVLNTGQPHQFTAETPAYGGNRELRVSDLVDPQFALGGLAAATHQMAAEPHSTHMQRANGTRDVSDGSHRSRDHYEYRTLTREQHANIAAMLEAGGRRLTAKLINKYDLIMPGTQAEPRHNTRSTVREPGMPVGQQFGTAPAAYAIASPRNMRTGQQPTSHASVQPQNVESNRHPLSSSRPAYAPAQPPRPAETPDTYAAARLAAPAVARQHAAHPAPVPVEQRAPLAPVQPERQISSEELAKLLRTIDVDAQPRQYRRMDLEAAAAILKYTPDGTETLAARQVRIDAERAQTVPLAIPLDENGRIRDLSTNQLPAVKLDRYGRIATDRVTQELPALPTDASGRLLPPLEEVMAQEAARNKLGILNEAIFLNFAQPADKLRMPLPPRGVNRDHTRLARRALAYIRAIPENSPESDLTAALRAAEMFVEPEELVAYGLAIAGITRAAKGEPLTQVATAVARSLEQAAQHHVEARVRQPLVHTDEQPVDPSTPAPAATATETESPRVQDEGVSRAVSTAASGFVALRTLYYQHDKSARDWVKTPGFISGIDQALAQADPGLYSAAAQYFSVRGVQMNHVIATALLDYDGPKDTAHFLPILHRSLSDVLSESGPNVAVAS